MKYVTILCSENMLNKLNRLTQQLYLGDLHVDVYFILQRLDFWQILHRTVPLAHEMQLIIGCAEIATSWRRVLKPGVRGPS